MRAQTEQLNLDQSQKYAVMCDSAPEKPVLTTQTRHQRVRPILSQSPPHATRPALPSEIDRGAPAQRGPGVQAQAHKDPAGLVECLAPPAEGRDASEQRSARSSAATARLNVNLIDGAPTFSRARTAYQVKRRKWQNGDAQGQRHLNPGQSHAAGTQGFMRAGHFPRTPKTDSHHISAPPIDDDGSSPVVLGCLKDSARL